jgi:hypothetical protein
MRRHYSYRMQISHWIDIVRELTARDQASPQLPGSCTYCSSHAVSWDYSTRLLNGATVIEATAVCLAHQARRDHRQRGVG